MTYRFLTIEQATVRCGPNSIVWPERKGENDTIKKGNEYIETDAYTNDIEQHDLHERGLC